MALAEAEGMLAESIVLTFMLFLPGARDNQMALKMCSEHFKHLVVVI